MQPQTDRVGKGPINVNGFMCYLVRAIDNMRCASLAGLFKTCSFVDPRMFEIIFAANEVYPTHPIVE
jgi:hypothetical protein